MTAYEWFVVYSGAITAVFTIGALVGIRRDRRKAAA